LILQLALKQADRFLLHADKSTVEQHQIKFLSHGRYHLINRIAKREIAAVPLKTSRTNLSRHTPAGKDYLISGNL
jgi:hypothetical protein